MPVIRCGESLGSLTRRPELDLLNVLKRDEARYPILRIDDHKGRDVRIHFLRNRRQVNEVGMIDRETTAGTGNDNKGRKRVRLDDVRNLFSRHRADIRWEFTENKQIILLLFQDTTIRTPTGNLRNLSAVVLALFASFRGYSIPPSPHPGLQRIGGCVPWYRH